MGKVFILLLLLLTILSTPVFSQDPQYSQFYSAPLYLNPAFAGATQLTRVGANFRTQWPAIDANFITTSAYIDHFIDDKNSGVGLLITSDKEGLAGLRSTSIGLQYSYQLPISDEFTIRAGTQVAYVLRDVNFGNLTFGDQFDSNGFINQPTAEVFDTGAKKSFFDLTFGGLLYSNSAWLGVAAHHINTPNQSLIGEDSPLPTKISIHIGYKFFMKSGVLGEGLYARPQERSIAPTLQYKKQGKFDQMDIGLYLTYEPILFGLWYRGIPFKNFDNFTNNEAIVFLIGFTKKGDADRQGKRDYLNIGYSYDFTISELGTAAGGAHEFSISYSWFTGDPRKPPKNVRLIPCPR